METAIQEKAKEWLASNIDEESKKAIQSLLEDGNESELTEAFYKDLEFGTGGLRGKMGVGSNRINKYTIGMATQGLANYLLKTYPDEKIKTAIAYDSRNQSKELAQITANVFSANGIYVYLFEDLRPTPELSFAIRELKCHGGVVLTASHNPKEYNGYKAYWNDGAQLIPPHDKNVIAEVQKIPGINAVKFQADAGLIEYIGKDIDEKYLNTLAGYSMAPSAIKSQHDLKIVFTPIHGTAINQVPPLLNKLGFTEIHTVEEQATPDGNFPTVVYPNPEEGEAMKLALEKARKIDADLVMATDPDADRVGIAVKNKEGIFQLLNGNQTAAVLIHYLLMQWQAQNKITGNQYIVKTIVTSDILENIASHFGVKCYETLTGFKYIAELIRLKESKEEFIGGGEESYGYLIGDKVRDKDAVISCGMIAEISAYLKDQGKSVFDFLIETYQKFGFFKENLLSITKEGKSGNEEINRIMHTLRENTPEKIGKVNIVKSRDYQKGIEKNHFTGEESRLDFPKSNVLQFITTDGSKIAARPSGTEPKIKFYVSVNTNLDKITNYETVDEQLNTRISSIMKGIKSWS